MLRALAVEAGAALRFGARVVDADTAVGRVTLAGGEVFSADIVVAADGFDSALRAAVTEDADAPPDAADAHVVATFQWHIWLGAGYIMNTNVLAGEEAFTATTIHDFAGPRTPHDADWAEGRALADLGIELKNFEPVPRKVLELATTVASRAFVRRPMPEDFVSANSRAVLVGEAAHPMLPASNHGFALVLEDAHTLGALFAHHRAARVVASVRPADASAGPRDSGRCTVSAAYFLVAFSFFFAFGKGVGTLHLACASLTYHPARRAAGHEALD
ncbi:hypothetical protein HYPSUDRAFT_208698 [Hypholoma sublateritium FD-334 SS-4]|uniref:FAD-binding domain-containing protein n=1 Tax=Hypholoma sublateritium (strain FD-334 SS-4) TaxID=945553 RepID=A0A0D2P1B3_HYPSF|nr:hypothetical protein HYPSUDRAFT_208698 [Hypholoma sublateritium FD-334 SS-4]